MGSLPVPSLDRIILLILSVVRVTSCPSNVQYSTNECLTDYNGLLSSLQMGGQTFFSGLDVETVRSICQSLRTSMQCAHQLKQSCPDTEHSEIEAVVSDYIAVVDLCSLDNLYEVYARHQTCYQRIYSGTQSCYEEYRNSADPLMDSIYQGNQQALKVMCSHYSTLVDCVENEARRNCDAEAADLLEYLIRPSIAMSENCRVEITTTTSQPPADEHPERSEEQGAPQTVNGACAGRLENPMIIFAFIVAFNIIKAFS